MSEQQEQSVVWVLSLDSLRAIDVARRTSMRVSGVHEASPREAGREPRSFEAVAPWPPVPGCPITLIWDTTPDRLQGTMTGPTIAAWRGSPELDWEFVGETVTHRGMPKVHAVNAAAAHALAVALRGPLTSSREMSMLTARDRAIYAGADLIGHATSHADAVAAVERLSAHPAAAVLGAGLAIAADPSCGAYRIDPGWILAQDDRPWTVRAQEALSFVGCEAHATGTEHNTTIVGSYRQIPFTVHWRNGKGSLTVPDAGASVELAAAGPLTAVSHGLNTIDALGDAVLLDIALSRIDR